MTLHPMDLDAAFVKGLRDDGLDDPAIREAANVGFHYNLINRVADAFDFPTPQGKQKARLAALLNTLSKVVKGYQAEPVWVRGADGCIRPTEVEEGRERLLSANGEADPELRQSVEAFVAGKWGSPRPAAAALPDDLTTYCEKLALHAHQITDEDVDALRAAGYSNGEIYEITIVGSFGVALIGLEQLFDSLYRETEDIA